MTRNHVLSDSEPSPLNPTFLSNFLASGCPPTLPVSDVPVRTTNHFSVEWEWRHVIIIDLRFGNEEML